jgi:hypothetical protein
MDGRDGTHRRGVEEMKRLKKIHRLMMLMIDATDDTACAIRRVLLMNE